VVLPCSVHAVLDVADSGTQIGDVMVAAGIVCAPAVQKDRGFVGVSGKSNRLLNFDEAGSIDFGGSSSVNSRDGAHILKTKLGGLRGQWGSV
jgi:hypothetical protein